VKDDLGEKNPDMCNITDKCQVKECLRHICLTWPDQSAVAEHSFIVEQHFQLQDTKTITSIPCYMDQNIREVTPDAVTRGWPGVEQDMEASHLITS